MGNIWTINFLLDEVERLYQEGYRLSDAIKIVKGYCSDQTNNNLDKKHNLSIALNEDIGNGEVYDKSTGITKRDLI